MELDSDHLKLSPLLGHTQDLTLALSVYLRSLELHQISARGLPKLEKGGNPLVRSGTAGICTQLTDISTDLSLNRAEDSQP